MKNVMRCLTNSDTSTARRLRPIPPGPPHAVLAADDHVGAAGSEHMSEFRQRSAKSGSGR